MSSAENNLEEIFKLAVNRADTKSKRRFSIGRASKKQLIYTTAESQGNGF